MVYGFGGSDDPVNEMLMHTVKSGILINNTIEDVEYVLLISVNQVYQYILKPLICIVVIALLMQ